MSEEEKLSRPKVSPTAQKQLDKAEAEFNDFDKDIKAMTYDRMNSAPLQEEDKQTKMSQNDLRNSKDIYLKPKKSLSGPDKFNEKYRNDYNFSKEYVYFVAEHKEIMGEDLDLWTKPFAGVPYENWIVPVNKQIWGPRYLAEQIQRKSYNRLKMNENVQVSNSAYGVMTGQLAVDTKVQRLTAYPATTARSVFMNSNGF